MLMLVGVVVVVDVDCYVGWLTPCCLVGFLLVS